MRLRRASSSPHFADVSRLASSAFADNKSGLSLSCSFADVAQLVERVTRNDKVAGSIPAIGSKIKVARVWRYAGVIPW
jgi:hypothetical protein